MKNGVVRIFMLLVSLTFIAFILILIFKNNIFNIYNVDVFDIDNINTFRINVEPVYDGYGMYYYDVDLTKGQVGHYYNSGIVNNQIKLINEKKLTGKEIEIIKSLIGNASLNYIHQLDSSEVSKYYKISNDKYIYDLYSVNELETILEK